jgi:hypothetical protein
MLWDAAARPILLCAVARLHTPGFRAGFQESSKCEADAAYFLHMGLGIPLLVSTTIHSAFKCGMYMCISGPEPCWDYAMSTVFTTITP